MEIYINTVWYTKDQHKKNNNSEKDLKALGGVRTCYRRTDFYKGFGEGLITKTLRRRNGGGQGDYDPIMVLGHSDSVEFSVFENPRPNPTREPSCG